MADNALSELGLVSELQSLISSKRNRQKLLELKTEAEKNWNANEDFIRKCQVKLGAHTAQSRRPEIVIIGDLAAFIPVPAVGADDTFVYVDFVAAKGLPRSDT